MRAKSSSVMKTKHFVALFRKYRFDRDEFDTSIGAKVHLPCVGDDSGFAPRRCSVYALPKGQSENPECHSRTTVAIISERNRVAS